MALALPIFGVAFASTCVWLTVRVINRRERWAKWTAVVVIIATAYPLSFGPAFWSCSDNRGRVRQDWVGSVFLYAYRPIIYLYRQVPTGMFDRYMGFWGMP